MRMNTRGRLAVNALIDLALHEQAGPVVLAAIAHRQRISVSRLESLFAQLRRAGVVDSTRGPGGGYTLGCDAAALTVSAIVAAVEDAEPGPPGVGRRPDLAADLSQRLQAVMHTHMAAISLAGLVARQLEAWDRIDGHAPHKPQAPASRTHPRTTAALPNQVLERRNGASWPGARPNGW